jgi:hypothetical protein
MPRSVGLKNRIQLFQLPNMLVFSRLFRLSSFYRLKMTQTCSPKHVMDCLPVLQDAKKIALTPTPTLRVKKLSENAKLPVRGSALAAGYDLYRSEPAFEQ